MQLNSIMYQNNKPQHKICWFHIFDVNIHFEGALLYWGLVTTEALGAQRTHCYILQTNLEGFKFVVMVHYCRKKPSEDGYSVVMKE